MIYATGDSYATSTGSSIYDGWCEYDYGTGTSSSAATITLKYPNNIWPYSYDGGTASCKKWYGTIKYETDNCATADPWSVQEVFRYAQDTATTWKRVAWENQGAIVPRKPEDRLKDIIQQRQAPAFIRSRKHLKPPEDIREVRARETLHRVLGDQKFRSFLKNGFVSVRAKSGLVYQIFPGHDITNVYQDGLKIERLCVVLKGRFPPTDSLIMRYLLILNDEADFRKHAISHVVHQRQRAESQVDQRPLTEIYREFKVA